MNKQGEGPPDFTDAGQTRTAVQPDMQVNQILAEGQTEVNQQTLPHPAVPRIEKTIVEWHQLIGAARLMWSKLSEAELLSSEGEEQKLTRIVSARYVLSNNTANAQVKKFLATQAIADWFQPAS